MAVPEPQRGEVWRVDLGYQGKVRPCLVLSVPATDVERNLLTYVPRTTRVRPGSRFEVIDASGLLSDPGAFDAQGLDTIDRNAFRQKGRRLGRLADVQLAEVEAAVKRWLGLND